MRKAIKILSVTAILAAVAAYRTAVTYADDLEYLGMSQRIPVRQTLKGGKYRDDYWVSFKLTAESADNPMPEGSVGTTKEMTVRGCEEPDFGPILFFEPGAYYYRITRAGRNAEGPEIDESSYRVMIAMLSNGNSEMVIWDERGAKVEKIIYTDHCSESGLTYARAADSPVTGDELTVEAAAGFTSVFLAAAAAVIYAVRFRRRM